MAYVAFDQVISIMALVASRSVITRLQGKESRDKKILLTASSHFPMHYSVFIENPFSAGSKMHRNSL